MKLIITHYDQICIMAHTHHHHHHHLTHIKVNNCNLPVLSWHGIVVDIFSGCPCISSGCWFKFGGWKNSNILIYRLIIYCFWFYFILIVRRMQLDKTQNFKFNSSIFFTCALLNVYDFLFWLYFLLIKLLYICCILHLAQNTQCLFQLFIHILFCRVCDVCSGLVICWGYH